MDTLNKKEQAMIKSLMKDDRWNAVTKFIVLKLKQWNEQEINGTSAFQELRALHTRDGKVTGIKEFFDQLEQQAYEQ